MTKAETQVYKVKTRVLIAPLDWGLGHATRCIPIIRELAANDCEVWIACNGMQENLLKAEFPHLQFIKLEGYGVKYAASKRGMFWKILFQLPRIRTAIKKENTWLKEMIKKYEFSVVISDNRFGLYHDGTHCIFITHQLNIKSPLGNRNERLLMKWNYKYINRFSSCWVPDMPAQINLAGELSHPSSKPAIPVQYIGPVSRFEKKNVEEINGHILVMLSGPEPQRTIFEDMIIDEIAHYPGTATVVRGLPSAQTIIPSSNMIKFHNHLPAEELNAEIEKAQWVIGRCGYSTVMDVMSLRKKSILVPTPGQTEQEYLARHLHSSNFACCIDQRNFSLQTALEKGKNFNYNMPIGESRHLLKDAILSLLLQFSD